MELFRSRSRAYSTLLLWMAVIFFFSSMSGSISGTIVSYDNLLVRKSAHVFEYLVLSFLSYNAFRLTYPRERRGFVILLSVVLSLLYAFSDETHQLFVPGREGKLTDVGIDLIGIAIGMIAVGTLAGKNGKT